MYGYIYKTTNLVNNKIYIGKKVSNEFQGNNYLGSGKLIKQAIKKYGKENFIVELLKQCSSVSELNESEKFYINKFNSTNLDIGYNISLGGDGGDIFHQQTLSIQKEIKSKISKNNAMKNNPEVREKRRQTMSCRQYLPRKGHTAWNKGLTKETDTRVKKYSIKGGISRKGRFVWNKGLTKISSKSLQSTSDKLKGNKNGLGNKSTKNKKYIHKNGKETCVNIEELNLYLNNGWELGGLPKGSNTYNSKKVLCLETGLYYDSISQASRCNNIAFSTLNKCIKEGKKIKNYTFILCD